MSRKQVALAFGGIWVLALAVRILLFTGYMNGDMGNYIQEAHNLFEGRYSVSEYFRHGSFGEIVPTPNFNWQNLRLGLILPVGLLFNIFGVSELSYAIYVFGCFTASLLILYRLGRDLHSPELGLTAVLIHSFIPMEINLSTILVPHIPAATFMALSCLLAFHGAENDTNGSGIRLFLAGAAMGVAYLTWEVSILMAPFLFAWVAWRRSAPRFRVSKRLLIDLAALSAGLALPMCAEFAYFLSATGIPFFRQRFISSIGPKWLILHPVDKTLLGWWAYPKAMFFSYSFGLFFYLVAAGLAAWAASRWRSGPASRESSSRWAFPVVWMLWIFLYLQFGSSSFTEYRPVFKISHYLVAISIPASLLAAYGFFQVPLERCRKWIRGRERTLYAIAGGAFALSSVACAAVNFTGNGPFHRDMTFEHRIRRALDELPPDDPVITDSWTKNGLDFVYRYKRPVLAFDATSASGASARDILSEARSGYVVVNWIYIRSPHTMGARFPEILSDPPRTWELRNRVRGSSQSIDIYRIL